MNQLTKAEFESYMDEIVNYLKLGLCTQRSLFFSHARTSFSDLEKFAMPYRRHGYTVGIVSRQMEWEVYVTC